METPNPDNEIQAPISAFENLKENVAWQEIREYFEIVRRNHEQDLRDPRGDRNLDDFHRGAIEAYEDMESVVDMFINMLQQEQNNNGRGSRNS